MRDRNYCPACGNKLETRQIERRSRDYCPVCERVLYRNPKPCAGVLVVDGPKVLLVERTEPPAVGAWSVPAGYLEHDETPLDAAVRELREETGVRVNTENVALQDTVFVRHPDGTRVLVVIYTAPVTVVDGEPRAGSDAAAARFWDVDTLLAADDDYVESGYESVIGDAVGRRQ